MAQGDEQDGDASGETMIRSPSYAARLRREALRLMREVEAQAAYCNDILSRSTGDLVLRATICKGFAESAERIFERLRKAGF